MEINLSRRITLSSFENLQEYRTPNHIKSLSDRLSRVIDNKSRLTGALSVRKANWAFFYAGTVQESAAGVPIPQNVPRSDDRRRAGRRREVLHPGEGTA